MIIFPFSSLLFQLGFKLHTFLFKLIKSFFSFFTLLDNFFHHFHYSSLNTRSFTINYIHTHIQTHNIKVKEYKPFRFLCEFGVFSLSVVLESPSTLAVKLSSLRLSLSPAVSSAVSVHEGSSGIRPPLNSR